MWKTFRFLKKKTKSLKIHWIWIFFFFIVSFCNGVRGWLCLYVSFFFVSVVAEVTLRSASGRRDAGVARGWISWPADRKAKEFEVHVWKEMLLTLVNFIFRSAFLVKLAAGSINTIWICSGAWERITKTTWCNLIRWTQLFSGGLYTRSWFPF